MDEVLEKSVEVTDAPQTPALVLQQPTEMAKPVDIPFNERTMWNDSSAMAMAFKMAKTLAATPMVPAAYKNQPGNCLIAIDFANRMNVSPLMVMQNLDVIQGNPGWRGQACIALVNNCGRFEPIQFDEKSDGKGEFSCIAYAKEKATGNILKSTEVNTALAKACGWLDKSGTYWKKMPEQMARYRAAAFFARTYCPEALMGLYTTDEIRDINGYEKPEHKIELTMKENTENGKTEA